MTFGRGSPRAVHRFRGRWGRLVGATAAALVVVLLLATVYLVSRDTDDSGAQRPSNADASLPGPGDAASDAASASAGPSASAPASASASASASRPAAARPGGRPGAANTGVVAGTRLTVVNGDQVFSRAGQVVEGLDIRGFVRIAAANVTIRNSVVRGGAPRCNSAVIAINRDASAKLEDVEVVASQPHPCLDGIWAFNATLTRVNVHGVVDGVKAFDNVTVQDSWIHDLSWFASDPNQGGDATHNDSVQTYEGNRNVTLRRNTLNAGAKGNAAYQVTQDGGKVAANLRIENNYLDGGGCTLNFSHKGGPAPMTGIYITGNRFGRGSQFNCPILVSTQTTLSQNRGNVYDDNGASIPQPQRHD
jgi:hypothetical protein